MSVRRKAGCSTTNKQAKQLPDFKKSENLLEALKSELLKILLDKQEAEAKVQQAKANQEKTKQAKQVRYCLQPENIQSTLSLQYEQVEEESDDEIPLSNYESVMEDILPINCSGDSDDDITRCCCRSCKRQRKKPANFSYDYKRHRKRAYPSNAACSSNFDCIPNRTKKNCNFNNGADMCSVPQKPYRSRTKEKYQDEPNVCTMEETIYLLPERDLNSTYQSSYDTRRHSQNYSVRFAEGNGCCCDNISNDNHDNTCDNRNRDSAYRESCHNRFLQSFPRKCPEFCGDNLYDVNPDDKFFGTWNGDSFDDGKPFSSCPRKHDTLNLRRAVPPEVLREATNMLLARRLNEIVEIKYLADNERNTIYLI